MDAEGDGGTRGGWGVGKIIKGVQEGGKEEGKEQDEGVMKGRGKEGSVEQSGGE